jgi:low temperature requirement protein LtrA
MPHSDSTSARPPEITSLELFFDLVFVFAADTQLSHHLLAHTDWRGAAETLVMLVGVFGAWSYTSFEVTLTHTRRAHLAPMMFVVMLLGLFMNAAIVQAFAQRPFAFVVPMLAIQIGRTLLSTIPGAPTPVLRRVLRRHYTIMLAWILASAPLWVAGAFAAPGPRLAWWGAAALIDSIALCPKHGTAHSGRFPEIEVEHSAEALALRNGAIE